MNILESAVKKEIRKVNLDVPITINVRDYADVYPHSKEDDKRQFVQISLGSDATNPNSDCACSYLDFWYDKNEKRIEHINYKLQDLLKNKGNGRKLVQAMEQVGKDMECKEVRINVNTNKPFWEHMGYKQKGDHWEKHLN